eukprot:TRINITY_DN14530_c0_g1_i3.p1 TRINITY_DN14530_c0_g1~~TRINITY_DN14530_c0_g1_i3.p1  ORF type:complete len:486 (-),score=162.06 TRINITY_DN14530_c0_g1_i3:75-1532(-)
MCIRDRVSTQSTGAAVGKHIVCLHAAHAASHIAMSGLSDSMKARAEADFALMAAGASELCHDAVLTAFGMDAVHLYSAIQFDSAQQISLTAWLDFVDRFVQSNSSEAVEALMERLECSSTGRRVTARQCLDASWPVVQGAHCEQRLIDMLGAVGRKLAGLSAFGEWNGSREALDETNARLATGDLIIKAMTASPDDLLGAVEGMVQSGVAAAFTVTDLADRMADISAKLDRQEKSSQEPHPDEQQGLIATITAAARRLEGITTKYASVKLAIDQSASSGEVVDLVESLDGAAGTPSSVIEHQSLEAAMQSIEERLSALEVTSAQLDVTMAHLARSFLAPEEGGLEQELQRQAQVMAAMEQEASSGMVLEAARMSRLEKCVQAVARACDQKGLESSDLMAGLAESLEKGAEHEVEDRWNNAEAFLEERMTDLEAMCDALGSVVSQEQELQRQACLLYTSDAADEEDSVDLGGRRIIQKKTNKIHLC